MAIEVVNGTPAQGLEFTVHGFINGSAAPPMWSGRLAPMNHSGSMVKVPVSGYVTYAVGFFPVGWLPNNGWALAWSPQVTDNTTVALTIDVMANRGKE
jgi:hypothetical protein